MSVVKLSVAAMLASVSLSSLAHAETTYFSSAQTLVQAASEGCSTAACVKQDPYYQLSFDPGGGPVSASRTYTFDEGTATATASGDLSTGAMKAYADVEADRALGAGSLAAQARVDIGDSFRAVSGDSPFTWTADDQASFTFDVSGVVDMMGASSDSAIVLTILAPGTLDAYARWAGGDDSAYYEWGPQTIADFTYSLGPGTTDYPWIDATATSYPTSFTATFNPGGDFDWVMTLNLDPYLGYPAGADAYGRLDFSHTVLASYQGPQGATTLSASGLFPGTVALDGGAGAVPEPAAWALMLMGFGAAGAVLRASRRRDGAPAVA
jgi:hypothetical protein